MDPNNPNNPDPANPGFSANNPLTTPPTPADSMTPPIDPTGQSFPPTAGNPSVSQGANPDITTTSSAPETASVWDISSNNSPDPNQQTPPAPQTPWPSSASTPGFDTPTTPAATLDITPPVPPQNPFLQPPTQSNISMPPSTLQPETAPAQPSQGLETPLGAPNPNMALPQDPLNTAFTPPATPPEANPFASPAQPPAMPETPAPGVPIMPETPLPEAPAQFANLPTDPVQSPQPQEVPAQPPLPPGNGTSPNSNPLDLLVPQDPQAQPGSVQPQQPNNTLPDMGPVENAPTDLSHLIAGEETRGTNDIYSPPVAQDQNPVVSPTQPTNENAGATPPPGKHLNLTKVLLIAGIPIILIIAALSAYIFLGIGKPASPETGNQTSLPIQQTQSTQAPLTNPPAQIAAPSPITIPEPKATSSAQTDSSLPSPVATGSPTSALEKLKARQASSPTPSAVASPSPAASSSTSLPTN